MSIQPLVTKSDPWRPVTIITMPTSKGSILAANALIDQGFSEVALISHALALRLDIKWEKIPKDEISSYNGLGSHVHTTWQVTVEGVKFPALSKSRYFTATFQVLPEDITEGYKVYIGALLMDAIDLDTSRRTKMITWGDEFSTPFVTNTHWKGASLEALIKGLDEKQPVLKQEVEVPQEENNVSKPDSLGESGAQSRDDVVQNDNQLVDESSIVGSTLSLEGSMGESDKENIGSNFAAVGRTFTDQKYEKPDLRVVANSQGDHLTQEQKNELYLVLKKNERVFQGCKGNYTGGEVDLVLKEGVKPVWNKPYNVPLAQRGAVERKVYRQCDVKALRPLTAEEVAEREWCFPIIAVTKKNRDIQVVIDLRTINPHFVRRTHPLPITHDMLTEISGFQFISCIDLNIGYMAFSLTEEASKLLTITTPFGYFAVLVLPQGATPAGDICQV